MLFTSFHFITFFAVVFSLNQALARAPTLQKWMLLVASYYFYGQWAWSYLALILISTCMDWAIGNGLIRFKRRRFLLLSSLTVNLGILAFFKYGNWLIANINAGSAWAGFDPALSPLDVLLPVGISFYTFQSMSYVIDVYRGDEPPRRSWLDYALFIAFFPQLVAGPIVRAREFFEQMDAYRRVDLRLVQQGVALVMFGFVKKMVGADGLATMVDPVFTNPAGFGFWDTLLAVYAFAFQIYFDFSGYTDIAIGIALMLGYRFPKNFDYPYVATSIQEFWRRWHMTLSRWLRDYLYIALGGNRRGRYRTWANLMLTMLLGGLWHGASWNFLIWGGLHGAYLAAERAILFRIPGWKDSRWWLPVRWLLTFHLVCLAWIFFRASDLGDSLQLIGNLTARDSFDQTKHLLPTLILIGFAVAHFAGSRLDWKNWLGRCGSVPFVLVVTAMLLVIALLTPGTSTPFIYFQF